MKIYTKLGDKGSTKLIGGKDVKKHNVQVDAYGSIDELNSYIGLIRDFTNDKHIKKSLIEIQKIFLILEQYLHFKMKRQQKNI
jgi:cob(I)alamin adenosyltransferase